MYFFKDWFECTKRIKKKEKCWKDKKKELRELRERKDKQPFGFGDLGKLPTRKYDLAKSNFVVLFASVYF